MQKLSPALVELVKLIARDLARDLAAQRMQADTPRKRLDRPYRPAGVKLVNLVQPSCSKAAREIGQVVPCGTIKHRIPPGKMLRESGLEGLTEQCGADQAPRGQGHVV